MCTNIYLAPTQPLVFRENWAYVTEQIIFYNLLFSSYSATIFSSLNVLQICDYSKIYFIIFLPLSLCTSLYRELKSL